MIRGGGVEAEPHEAAHRQRIGRAPGDAAFRVEPFEVPEQQQSEVPPWRQSRSPHYRRVERPTLLLHEPVEAGLIEDGVQARVERVTRRDRQVGGRNPHRDLLALAFSHRHEPHFTFTPSFLTRGFLTDFHHGLIARVRSFNANRDNSRRWHSALDYPSPIAYETREQSLA